MKMDHFKRKEEKKDFRDDYTLETAAFLMLTVGFPVLLGVANAASQTEAQKIGLGLHPVGECVEYVDHASEIERIDLSIGSEDPKLISLKASSVKDIDYVERDNVQLMRITKTDNDYLLLPHRDLHIEVSPDALEISSIHCYIVSAPKSEDKVYEIDISDTESVFFDEDLFFSRIKTENAPDIGEQPSVDEINTSLEGL